MGTITRRLNCDEWFTILSFSDPASSNRILAIRQVIPNSVGYIANLKRGQYIIQIDGTNITSENVSTLLSPDTYTIHFADHNDNGTPETSDDTFTANGTTNFNKGFINRKSSP